MEQENGWPEVSSHENTADPVFLKLNFAVTGPGLDSRQGEGKMAATATEDSGALPLGESPTEIYNPRRTLAKRPTNYTIKSHHSPPVIFLNSVFWSLI